MKTRTELNKQQREELFQLVDSGMPKKEVAEHVGCHWQTVYNYIKMRGD